MSGNQNTNQIQSFEDVLKSNGVLVFTNKGVSMMPLLRQDRDLMVIEPRPEGRCKNLDAVLFKRDNGQYVLHRILKVTDRGYWIVGDNCVSGECVREDQILGVLKAIVRDGRNISVTDNKYRIYVNTWCRHYRIRFFILRVKNVFTRIYRLLKRK